MRNIAISTIITALLIVILVNMPIKYLNLGYLLNGPSFGALSLTDISSTDNISAFPTVQNANNSLIETEINNILGTTTISTVTSLPALTTAGSLATIGTITTGTWSADTIAVNKGGTNLTSYTSGDILYATGATTLAKLAKGTDGQILGLSSGLPVWQSGAVNESLNYDWTGYHTFAYSSTTYASTTQLTVDGIVDFTGATIGVGATASSSVLSADASGHITANRVSELGAGYLAFATTTDFTVQDSSTETKYLGQDLATLTGNDFGSNDSIEIDIYGATQDQDGSGNNVTYKLYIASSTICQKTTTATDANLEDFHLKFIIFSVNSENAQSCLMDLREIGGLTVNVTETTSTVDLSGGGPIAITSTQTDGLNTQVSQITSVTIKRIGNR